MRIVKSGGSAVPGAALKTPKPVSARGENEGHELKPQKYTHNGRVMEGIFRSFSAIFPVRLLHENMVPSESEVCFMSHHSLVAGGSYMYLHTCRASHRQGTVG